MAVNTPLRGAHEARIFNLISQGRFEEVVNLYYSGILTSAREHHGVFIALCATKAPMFRLVFVETKARRDREGYKEVALDFLRDWALYYAEVKNDLVEARRIINQVTKEGGTLTQRVLGWLASGKIRLRDGETEDALNTIEEARNLAYQLGLPKQVLRDCDWWLNVATTLKEAYPESAKLARTFVHGEPKMVRRVAYLIAGWVPYAGPRATEALYKRQLRL